MLFILWSFIRTSKSPYIFIIKKSPYIFLKLLLQSHMANLQKTKKDPNITSYQYMDNYLSNTGLVGLDGKRKNRAPNNVSSQTKNHKFTQITQDYAFLSIPPLLPFSWGSARALNLHLVNKIVGKNFKKICPL